VPTAARQFVGLPAAAPLEFVVDGDVYELPALPSRVWLNALVLARPGCWIQIVPTQLAGDGPQRLSRRLVDVDDDLQLDDIEHIAETVITQACGIDFPAALQLAATAYSSWLVFDGWCTSRGFDPESSPISRVLAAVYHWRRSLCQEKGELARLENEVWQLPPSTTVTGRPRDATPAGWDDETEAAGFMTAMEVLARRK
jgi:hypothetical protein